MQRGGGLYVSSPPLVGSTSAGAGVKKGDRIVSIDGTDTKSGKVMPRKQFGTCLCPVAVSDVCCIVGGGGAESFRGCGAPKREGRDFG